jgi:hypothetical protein
MKYHQRPRAEPTSEEFLALLILLGPLAFVARWIWRCLLRKDQEQHGKHYKTRHDEASSFQGEDRTPWTREPITNMTSRRRNAINAVTFSSSPSAPAPLCAPLRRARLCWLYASGRVA